MTVTVSAETQVLMACIDDVRQNYGMPPVSHHVADPDWIRSDWESTMIRLRLGRRLVNRLSGSRAE